MNILGSNKNSPTLLAAKASDVVILKNRKLSIKLIKLSQQHFLVSSIAGTNLFQARQLGQVTHLAAHKTYLHGRNACSYLIFTVIHVPLKCIYCTHLWYEELVKYIRINYLHLLQYSVLYIFCRLLILPLISVPRESLLDIVQMVCMNCSVVS